MSSISNEASVGPCGEEAEEQEGRVCWAEVRLAAEASVSPMPIVSSESSVSPEGLEQSRTKGLEELTR